MRFILTEGTKYDQKASRVISSSGLYDEATSDAIIKALFEEDIHAFVHSPNWLEKYLVGIARMLVEESAGDRGRAEAFLNECGPVFDEYLTWIKANRTEENKQKLDNEFVNKMKYQDVKNFLDRVQSELDAQSKDELSKMDFSKSSSYTLVPIDSYEEFHNKYGGHWTGDGSSDSYAGAGGTAWCHTNSKNTYDSWTQRGDRFFVLQNNNWKNIPFDEKSNAQNPKDTYGTSLIAIRVDKYGRLKNATLRCNHVGINSNADNQYETYAELSKIAGFNVEQAVLDELGEIEEYTPLTIENNILVECDENATVVTIPDSVTSIGNQAFYGCSSLASVTIPDSVTNIGYVAFSHCTNLESIIIPNSVRDIDSLAFIGCPKLVVYTKNLYVIDYCKNNNIPFEMLTTNESLTLTEALNQQGYPLFTEDTMPPKKTGKAYKVFKIRNGKLYPPMVANPSGKDTPVGVWLEAEEGEFAGVSKTGRPQVKAIGSGTLSYRPGWHLGDVPRAPQFDRTNKETGEKEFPKDFVWAECDYAMDVDYQPESDEQGYMRTTVDKDGNVRTWRSDKYQHSLAGLPKLPKDGFYRYRTNPNPNTVPWVITGKIKVNRLLSDEEVNDILKSKGIEPIHRQGGDKTLSQLGLNESVTLTSFADDNVDDFLFYHG